jgi:hypothetical protein
MGADVERVTGLGTSLREQVSIVGWALETRLATMRLALVRGVGGPSDRILSVVRAARVAFPRRLSLAFADASMLEVSDEHLLVFDCISSDTELCAFATGSSQLTLPRALMIHMDFMDQRRVGGHAPRPPAGAGVAAAASVLSFVYNEGIADFIDTIVIVFKATGLEVDELEKIAARFTALLKEAPNRQPVVGAALHDLNSSLVQIGAQTKSMSGEVNVRFIVLLSLFDRSQGRVNGGKAGRLT